jgi:hypothetical protein
MITVAQALKIKNRLLQAIRQRKEQVERFNSVPKGTERGVDIDELLEEINVLEAELLALLCAINEANAGEQQRRLVRLRQIDSAISWLNNLDTTDGIKADRFGPTSDTEYTAHVDYARAQRCVEELRDERYDLQDEVDHFNATNRIDWGGSEVISV